MSDIFVSYRRSDKSEAQCYVDAFTSMGWSTWWDEDISTGRVWSADIEDALRASKCVVVLWSKRSVRSEWVRREVRFAIQHNIALLPVRIDNCALPEEFSHIQCSSCIDWDRISDGFFETSLAGDIARVLRAVTPEAKSIKLTDEEKVRVLSYSVILRDSLFDLIPIGSGEDRLVIAIWDIKEFGTFRDRLGESHFYIATICNQFDLIFVPVLKSSLGDPELLLEILAAC